MTYQNLREQHIYLHYGFALLKQSLAFMGSVENQREMAPKDALVRDFKDRLPPWHNSAKLFQRCDNIVISFDSTIPFIRDIPLALAHPISWHPPDEGMTLVALFGDIET